MTTATLYVNKNGTMTKVPLANNIYKSLTTVTTASTDSTTYTTPTDFTVGANQVSVWYDGLHLALGTDFTENSNGKSITILSQVDAGTIIDIEVVK